MGLILVTAIVLSACSEADLRADSTPATRTATSTTTTTGRHQSTSSTTSVPASGPLRARFDWFVGQINATSDDPTTVAEGFAPSSLASMPLNEIVAAVANAVSGGTEWTITDTTGLGSVDGAVIIASSHGAQLRVALSIEPDGDHRITGMQFGAVVFPPGEPVTPAAFDSAVRALAPNVSFGLYDITDGNCRLVHGVDENAAQPIGSAFKLWILAALATEIDAKRASWDETMPVTAALISSPDGTIASTPIGTTVTLRRYAELMIAISDNSATDHLLHRLGRKTVEDAMRESGAAHPDQNIPMLSTRELFLLKYGRTMTAEDYLALKPAARRAALDTKLAGVNLVSDLRPGVDTSKPSAVDTVEWFATPLDECRTQLRLAELATKPGLEPVAGILRMNPGAGFGSEWTDVRFKGGSEAGLAYGSWRLTRNNGRTYVLAGGATNTTAPVNSLRIIGTITTGVRLLDN